MICTDVLPEGQNLQDSNVVVNFDLPWAIIRLIQCAGRVDRIGQRAEEIFCYSFLPADGVEDLIKLRARIRQRLKENAEVVGTDEEFLTTKKPTPYATSTPNNQACLTTVTMKLTLRPMLGKSGSRPQRETRTWPVRLNHYRPWSIRPRSKS